MKPRARALGQASGVLKLAELTLQTLRSIAQYHDAKGLLDALSQRLAHVFPERSADALHIVSRLCERLAHCLRSTFG